MKYKLLRLSLLSAFAVLFGGAALGALMSSEGTKLIDFPTSGTGITANGTTEKGSTEITLKNSYTGNNVGNNIALAVEGGFKTGDIVTVAGYINKTDKRATVVLFSTPAYNSTDITKIKTFDDFVNYADGKTADDITEQSFTLESDYDALYLGRDGSTGCNVTIIKVVRPGSGNEGGSGEGGSEVTFPITATWSFTDADIVAAVVAISGTTNSTQIENNGLKLTVEANGKTIRDNSNSIQTGDGVVFKVPVQGKKDVVKVTGYASPYFAYSIAGVDATEAVTEYTATAADVAQGYVEVVNKGQNLISISVTQNEDDSEDEPVAQDITATWDFVHNCANLDTKANGGAYTAETMASDVDGISMTIVYNGGQIKNNDNSYMIGNGVELRIPVKNVNDLVTVVGYPGYFHYSVAGVEAENQTTEYKAKASDVEKGYVSVVATASNNYINSISVTQYAPKSGNIQEKSIYKTDFSNWETISAAKSETKVDKTTKFTNETLTFGIYNTALISTNDSKFSDYTTLPHNALRAEKAADPYITTSTLKDITKVRFVHAATGGNRGWKLEAKGDGDADWVVVSDAVANPAGWSEVKANINRKNCQLRFTNLTNNQYAFMFELEIFGNVDLSGAPLLGSFKANGTEYVADEIFEMNSEGEYEGTIEVSKSDKIISESNKLADIVADNGEIGTVTYATTGEGATQKTTVTIPVTAEGETVNYVLSVIFKPDFTLTYYDVEGKEFGTQTVEKDAKIGEFAKDVADVTATKEGYKARGWFKNNYVGEKFTVEDIITTDTKLYAVETEIEVSSDSRKYEFDLTSKTFYAEDHEAFNVTSEKAKWHDNTHGWSFYNGDKIELLVGKKATITIGICNQGHGTNILVKNATGETLETLAAKSETDGALVSYNYEGEAGALTLEMEASGEMYLHSVKIFNTSETNYDQKGQWIFVKESDASSLLDAIDAANNMSGTERVFIYVPNGTYDLGQTTLTTIERNNISIIGESMEGSIIKNRPIKEGIAITATLLNTATNTYLQDLTLDCIAPYGTGDDTKSAERGVCLQDKGTNTICKNVYLKGLQDTYYSNNNSGTFYFEDCKIEGSVDYVCGNGDVYFNKTLFYTVNKSVAAGGAAGGVIAAPNTKKSFGYIFNECTLDGMANEDGKYRLGRPWASGTIVRMLNTQMLIKPTAAGWDEWSTDASKQNSVEQFAEYNSVDKDGNAVDLSQRKTSFKGLTNNPIITAEEAANYTPEAIFNSTWTPATATVQLDAPTEVKIENGTITWTAVDGAAGYAIYADDELLAIVGADVTSYVIQTAGASRRAEGDTPVYTVRTVNAMGGFGEAKTVSDATGISKVNADLNDEGNLPTYNLNGQRVDSSYKGVVIKNGKKVIVK